MATADRDDIRDRDDELVENPSEEARTGAAGALTAGVTGATNPGGGLMGSLGSAVGGEMVAGDLMDDEMGDGAAGADTADSPEGFAGGGATSAGRDD